MPTSLAYFGWEVECSGFRGCGGIANGCLARLIYGIEKHKAGEA